MRLAFCLFRYFPFGGLQRDFLRIALACRDRGHQVEVFTGGWEGEVPEGLTLHRLSLKGWGNHVRARDFARQAGERTAGEGFSAVVGFNKMPGLDLYYAADPCYLARVFSTRGPLYRLGPRFRTYAALEKAVFVPEAGTEILLIAEGEKEHFIRSYGTPEKRFHLLPPGIARDRVAPPEASEIRADLRRELGLSEEERMLLMVGSGFRTKGLDRAIRGLAALPDALRGRTRLFVIGRGKEAPYRRLARRLGVEDRLQLLGGREDVPRFLLAADLLVHPAVTENTGTALVEALASGLPVLATEVCGYGFHIRDARAGRLVPEPFRQGEFDRLLAGMLDSPEGPAWRANALDYARRTDLFSLPQRAAEIIERVALERGRG